ncbi:MAG: tyrosine-type recombinase/integrase [Candidatus Sabulitectum sp.]|nr:tyrosine-type recombinase/integrase [Candidatus Sabulitectum sp.]
MKSPNRFCVLLESFFTDRLMTQLRASPHTIASYRDTFCLLFAFVKERLGKDSSTLQLKDLDAPLVADFLFHLEEDRGNSPRSRNLRLAAIHSFCRYAAMREPSAIATLQRVLSIPSKRFERKQIGFLIRSEVEALLAAPDPNTWSGRRDQALLMLAVQTGLRLSELVGLRCGDIILGSGSHVRCQGKGRKGRCTPLRKDTEAIMHAWLAERNGSTDAPLFPNMRGGVLSASGVQYLVNKHASHAAKTCSSMKRKKVSPHILRHTAAMDLLQSGVDRSVIALWLGHESMETTQIYLHADLQMKEKALALTAPHGVAPGRYKPADDIMAFLKSL